MALHNDVDFDAPCPQRMSGFVVHCVLTGTFARHRRSITEKEFASLTIVLSEKTAGPFCVSLFLAGPTISQ